jgi:hypothetical protein
MRPWNQGRGQGHAAAPAAVGTVDQFAFDYWTIREKREYLIMLSTKLWDIEDELARARTERASLMRSLQGDLRGRRSCS